MYQSSLLSVLLSVCLVCRSQGLIVVQWDRKISTSAGHAITRLPMRRAIQNNGLGSSISLSSTNRNEESDASNEESGGSNYLPANGSSSPPSSSSSSIPRRKAIATAMAGLSAEAGWRHAVALAATTPPSPNNSPLPPGTIELIESGRAAIIPNWISPAETAALCTDVQNCFAGGHFTNFILSRNPNKADKAANDRWIMPSFSKARTGDDGPFANPLVGDIDVRLRLKARMAEVKAFLAEDLYDRPTLVNDVKQTHEMEYLRYGAGALLQRHTDEHHVELKRMNGSRLPKKPNASRRSITWMVYLNDEWDGGRDGGQLRLHERAEPTVTSVGSRGGDLQVGWLRARGGDEERPVFLDPFRGEVEGENCILYTVDGRKGRRDLSSKPFANVALYLGGGDGMARKIMVEGVEDRERFHLIDAPKSLVSSLIANKDNSGEDGGERVTDVVPKAGTLVMFDSVSLPHEVLLTNRERFGVQGWFHEKLSS